MMSLPGRLYPILDADTCRLMNRGERDLLALWREAGLGFYQLRAKGYSEEAYMRKAEGLKSEYPEMSIIANDFVLAATERGDLFAGIHLGQEDLISLGGDRIEILNRLAVDCGFVTGLSTHSLAQVVRAIRERGLKDSVPWSYIAVGPIFATGSKPLGADPVISEGERISIFAEIGNYLDRESDLTAVIIGGLNPENFVGVISKDFCAKFGFLPVPAMINSISERDSLNRWITLLGTYYT